MAPREDGPWGVREIAKGVRMNPSTVHRVLGLLEEEGLVRQDDPGGGYGLGTELLRLAWTAAGSHPVRSAALPHMRELAAASGETVTLGLYDPVRQQTCVLAVVESDAPFRYVSNLHGWRDLYTGASGRAVMAFLPEDERRAIVERTKLAPATEHTITHADELGFQPRQILGGEPVRSHRRREQPVQVQPDRHGVTPTTAPEVRHRARG